MRRYNQGWKGESTRHSLAAQGVKTGVTFVLQDNKVSPKMPDSMLISAVAADAFDSAKWMLTHTHKGKDPYATVDEAVESFVEKKYLSRERAEKVKVQARKYMDDQIKVYGVPPLTAKGDDPWYKRAFSEDDYNRAMDSMNNPSHRHENAKMRHEDVVKAEKLISKSALPLRAESIFVSQLQDEGQKYRLKGFTTHEARELAEADRIKSFRKHVKIEDD